MTKDPQGESARANSAATHLFGHGRLSYVEIPAIDVRESADGIDHLSFTDATGDMIGAWVTGRVVSRESGVLPYIYVHGIDAILEQVTTSDGEIVTPPYPEGDLWVATFRDPAGNVIGVWPGASLSLRTAGNLKLQRSL